MCLSLLRSVPALAALAVLSLTGPARAQTTITTIPGSSSGTSSSANLVVGQIFTAPADNVLTSFAFQIEGAEFVGGHPAIVPLTLSIFVYDEATNTTVGPALFTSAPTSIGTVSGLPGYSFSTGDLVLTTGQVYVALLSGADTYSGPLSLLDPYPSGRRLLIFWGDSQVYNDNLAFTATFEAEETPETLLSNLIAKVRGLGLPKGIENSLVVKLEAALSALEAEDTATACQSLQDFIDHALAQSGKKLPMEPEEDLAQQLIDDATYIRTQLGCS